MNWDLAMVDTVIDSSKIQYFTVFASPVRIIVDTERQYLRYIWMDN